MINYINKYLNETKEILNLIDKQSIYNIWQILHHLNGRLFILGIGGSAANASHAVNDFRKIMGIDAYAPTDNISEFSARINDDGWQTSFVEYLKVSNLSRNDCIMILSVSGGNEKKSKNIIKALEYADIIGTKVIGIVGGDGGYTAKLSDICIIVPTINEDMITSHTEELQSIIWHLIVNYK